MKKIDMGKVSPPEERDRIKEAEMDYRKMWEEIKPFIKKREIKRYSTAGQWKVSSCDLLRRELRTLPVLKEKE